MNRYRFTPEANNDLDDIFNHLVALSPAAATRVLNEIEARVRLLARFPGLGRDRPDLAPGLKSSPAGKFLILYRVEPGGIEVVRVVYGGRDLTALAIP
jgi:toxin ParE1/3/4